MHHLNWTRRALALLAAALLLAGCNRADDRAGQTKNAAAGPKSTAADDHGGWWCNPHGIPEADCSMCLPAAEVRKRFKDKGDWCGDHDRAKSQCFICDPSLREKFAKIYRSKEGKDPPEPKENMPDKKDNK